METIIGVIVYSLLEYWLGKTPKTKAGSVIEAVLLIPEMIKGKKDDGKTDDSGNKGAS